MTRYYRIKAFDRPNFVSLLYLMEQIGLPVQYNGRLPAPLINPEMIAKHVFDAPFGMATHLLCSCGVALDAKEYFDRSLIIGMDGKSADAIVKRLIDALDEVVQRWSTGSERVISFLIPIGRLCCKVQDTSLKLRFVKIISEVFEQEMAAKEAESVNESLALLIDSLQVVEIKSILPQLFVFKAPQCSQLLGCAYNHPCEVFANRWIHFLGTAKQDKPEYDIDWSNVREELNSKKQPKVFWAAKAAVLAERLNILPRDLHLRLLDFSKSVIRESPEKFITQMDFSFLLELFQKNNEPVDVGSMLSGVIESCNADIFDNCFVPILVYCHCENVSVSISAKKGQALLRSLIARLKSACEKLTKTGALCGDIHAEFFRSNIKCEVYASYFKLLYLVDFIYRFGIVDVTLYKEIGAIRELLEKSNISTLGLDWFATKDRKMTMSVLRRLCSDLVGPDTDKSAIAYNCSVDIIERSWNDAEMLLSSILMNATHDKTRLVVNLALSVERHWGERIKFLLDNFSVYLSGLRDVFEDAGRELEERLRIARDAIRVRTIVVRACPASDKPSGAIYDYWVSEVLEKSLPFAEIRNAENF